MTVRTSKVSQLQKQDYFLLSATHSYSTSDQFTQSTTTRLPAVFLIMHTAGSLQAEHRPSRQEHLGGIRGQRRQIGRGHAGVERLCFSFARSGQRAVWLGGQRPASAAAAVDGGTAVRWTHWETHVPFRFLFSSQLTTASKSQSTQRAPAKPKSIRLLPLNKHATTTTTSILLLQLI